MVNTIDMNGLYSLIDEYWKDYTDKKNLPGVAKDIVPIIWFGDIFAYLNSEIKTVTVSLNPSCIEFMNDKKKYERTYRFKDEDKFTSKLSLNQSEKDDFIKMLNQYFLYHPYKNWFNDYDKRVMGYISKYIYDVGYNANFDVRKHSNTAIHIDYYTPLATDPTWGKLIDESEKYEETLDSLPNIDLFIKLLNYLNPDVILFSSNYDAFHDCMVKYSGLELPRPDVFQKSDYPIHKGLINSFLINGKLVIHGRYRNTPFAPIDDALKDEVFDKISKIYTMGVNTNGDKRWFKL